jgi:branched-chain amino acid transport system permease protein
LIPQMIVSGILLGGVYGCVATGFSLITGVLKIFNFAHGAFIMLGAYATWILFSIWSVDPFLALPATMLVLFVMGYLVQRFLINRVVRAPLYMTLILTFGLDMVFVNAATLAWSANLRSIKPAYSVARLTIGSVSIPYVRLAVFATALILTGLLYVLMNKTRVGKAINATRMDLDAAKLVGVDSAKVYAITFGLGTALAGAAGGLLSILSSISPTMGTMYSSKAFAICVLGGFGHMAGALVGGLLMGLFETLAAVVVGPGYQSAIAFAVLVLVLIIRPSGILGREYY